MDAAHDFFKKQYNAVSSDTSRSSTVSDHIFAIFKFKLVFKIAPISSSAKRVSNSVLEELRLQQRDYNLEVSCIMSRL